MLEGWGGGMPMISAFGARSGPDRHRAGAGVEVVPAERPSSPEGLPIGLQLVAGRGREHLLWRSPRPWSRA